MRMRSGRCCNRHCDHACMQPNAYSCTCNGGCYRRGSVMTLLSWLAVGAIILGVFAMYA